MKIIKNVLALLITVVCLYVAFQGVDFKEALSILDTDRIRLIPLTGFAAICCLVFFIRAWRWIYLYRPEHKATIGGLTVANFIGFMTNNILPFRIGELVRALMARRKVNAPLSYTLAVLVIERILDTMCLLTCLMLPLLLYSNLPSRLVIVGKIMFGVLIGSILLLVVLRSKPHLLQKIFIPVGRKLLSANLFGKLEYFLHTFTDGLKILRNSSAMWKVVLLSLFHWWVVVYGYGLAFKGFSFDSLPWSAPYLAIGLVGVSVALPSAPAFVGPFHFAIIYTLSDVFGIEKSAASGFAVIMHLLAVGPITVIGLLLMWREGLTLGQIRKRASHLEEEPPGQSEGKQTVQQGEMVK